MDKAIKSDCLTTIARVNSNFEREPLSAPLGFKGGRLTELWQSVALLESESGNLGLGLGTQSPLWSDAETFAARSEFAANQLMYRMTAFALEMCKGRTFDSPPELLEELSPRTLDYGRTISGNPELRPTFALNALVAVDNAAWQVRYFDGRYGGFDEMLPDSARAALTCRQRQLACVPLISYGVAPDDIIRVVTRGHFCLKIKIGCDPDGDGDLEKMLRWDMDRLSLINSLVGGCETPYTNSGRVAYYLDANGRYDSKERLLRFLDHAQHIGALERVIVLEEPFPEDYEAHVSDIPVRLAADESAHTDEDAGNRIEMGYGAIALKPIAKTLSMSLKIVALAHSRGVPCFCADLTVNPVLADWNKNMAARLDPLPGLSVGIIEVNGPENYRNWELLKSYHPRAGAEWIEASEGMFSLSDEFYRTSGGIFEISDHYLALVR